MQPLPAERRPPFEAGDILLFDQAFIGEIPAWKATSNVFSRPVKVVWIPGHGDLDIFWASRDWRSCSMSVSWLTKKGTFSRRSEVVYMKHFKKVGSTNPSKEDLADLTASAFSEFGDAVGAAKRRSAKRASKLKVDPPEYNPRS